LASMAWMYEVRGRTTAEWHRDVFRDVDVVVGMPNRLMEMARGFRWQDGNSIRRWKGKPEIGLGKVWVVVDETNVLFGKSCLCPLLFRAPLNFLIPFIDPDFTDTTKLPGEISASPFSHPSRNHDSITVRAHFSLAVFLLMDFLPSHTLHIQNPTKSDDNRECACKMDADRS